MIKSVSIVIPLYNSEAHIQKTLEACLDQELPRDVQMEVIAVDDGSSDSGPDMVENYPVKLIRQENKGPAAARNAGWKAAKGEVIFFTDSDCVPKRDWVAKLLVAYDDEEVAGAGGTYDIINKESLLASAIHEEIIVRHLAQPREVNYLGSFNLSYRRRTLEEVGGFNEEYKRASGEDNDLAYRVKKRGYKLIFARDSAVAHFHPDKLFAYLRQQFRHGCWRMKIYKDHPDMAAGDSYGGLFDFIQPPLGLLILTLLPACLIYPAIFRVNSVLLLFYIIIQIPLPHSIVKRTGSPRYYIYAFHTFLRGFCRGAGMVVGLIKFRPFVS